MGKYLAASGLWLEALAFCEHASSLIAQVQELEEEMRQRDDLDGAIESKMAALFGAACAFL
eukprot:6187987-Pleurochrysis_carterae.AAC.8